MTTFSGIFFINSCSRVYDSVGSCDRTVGGSWYGSPARIIFLGHRTSVGYKAGSIACPASSTIAKSKWPEGRVSRMEPFPTTVHVATITSAPVNCSRQMRFSRVRNSLRNSPFSRPRASYISCFNATKTSFELKYES